MSIIDQCSGWANNYVVSTKEVKAAIATKIQEADAKFAGHKIKIALAHAYINVIACMKPSHVVKTLAFCTAKVILTLNKAKVWCETELPKLYKDVLSPACKHIWESCVSMFSKLYNNAKVWCETELPKLSADMLKFAEKCINQVWQLIQLILKKFHNA